MATLRAVSIGGFSNGVAIACEVLVAKQIYLRKANNDLISHCRCDPAAALIADPGQLDCPWCGCGWLFSCVHCQRAFTFAEGIEIDESLSDMARLAIASRFRREAVSDKVDAWVFFMESFLEDVRLGEKYVYLDGSVLPVFLEAVTLDGWYAKHDLPFVPQVKALTDASVMNDVLLSRRYWEDNHLEDDNQGSFD